MAENQAASEPQKQPSQSQSFLSTGVMIWSVFSVLVPIFGIPLTWLVAKKLKSTQKIAVTAIGILPWLFFSNYKSETQPNTAQTPSQTTAISTQPQSELSPKIVPIRTWTNVRNDRAIRVISSEILSQITPSNQFADPISSKGGKLVVVYIDLKNTGQESGDMFWSRFHLLDAQGRKYDEIQDFEEQMSISMWLEDQGLEKTGNQMFPGATAKTAKVFRVASDASDLQMISNDTVFEIQNRSQSSVPKSSDNSATQLAVSTTNQTGKKVQAADGYANLRIQPSTEVQAIAKLPNGTSVKILNQRTNSSGQLWYQVEVNGKTGWIFSGLLK